MRKVAVFTGNRAEYGLLFPVLQAIHHASDLALCLIVGGDHPHQGTIVEIQRDGFPIHTVLKDDSFFAGTASQRMCGMTAFTTRFLQTALEQEQPDCFLVLGDRFETFAAALAAFYEKIPILHLGGGDITEGGCVDDALRFMISEMAAHHVVFSREAREHLIRRGIPSENIFLTASPIFDNLRQTRLIPKVELIADLGDSRFNGNQPIALFTQHPIPAEGMQTVRYFQQSLDALAGMEISVIATYPNFDGLRNELLAVIEVSRRQHANITWVPSLGRQRYLSWMAACDVVVGNSSSGLIETPFFQKPSVTIGPRQAGRVRGKNVIEASYGIEPVRSAIRKALHDHVFLQEVKQSENPFGGISCATEVCRIIREAYPMSPMKRSHHLAPTL